MKRAVRKDVWKHLPTLVFAAMLCLCLTACNGGLESTARGGPASKGGENAHEEAGIAWADRTVGSDGPEAERFHIAICGYVDDMDNASLDPITESILARFEEIGAERDVLFAIRYGFCNADTAELSRILSDILADEVDLMIGITTPVAAAMRAATEKNGTPVIFSAVSDPESAQLVVSNDAPGGNLTGTSDYLDTSAVMDLIFAANPDAVKIGLLYDREQDASRTPVGQAKDWLMNHGVEIIERTGTTTSEVMLAAQALVADGVDAVFTPTDNTILAAESSIRETFTKAGIPHYTGADAFARNGAFLGYGVDYTALGAETADMAAEVLLDGADPAATPVRVFDDGIATVNADTCAALGLDYETIKAAFEPLCTRVESITTEESLNNLER